MLTKPLKPQKSLSKAYLKIKPHREEFENFKYELEKLLNTINENESEEHNKKLIANFLENTFYLNNFVNTKGSTDLAIYIGRNADSNVGVIFEIKRPAKTSEMITKDNLNTKAIHEVILYYLRERIEEKNDDIKYIIITNAYEWFIFDAQLFEKLFYKNKKLLRNYSSWKNDQKVNSNTDYFYNEIAKPFLKNINGEIEFTHFDLRNYRELLDVSKDEKKLIYLFKLFSPIHLLKQTFVNDSNTLDKQFYKELLYIIGLEEVKDGSKKIIRRKQEGERNSGSLLENTIGMLESERILDDFSELEKYGRNREEQLFNIALELNITWINRILFLKLLEAQLVNYHKGSNDFKFLDFKYLTDYDDLFELFHEVLARKFEERKNNIIEKFKNIPYLNSSLFEISSLEQKTIKINSLKDRFNLTIFKQSVLINRNNHLDEISALEYLLKFLDAYDFASDTGGEVQENKKSLINASVLGLIFEKINGYQEGSFFTPGFITMYMARETIRLAVIQKFEEAKGWKCESISDLRDKIEYTDKNVRKEANDIINSIKICDPAVGSGHFLVSSLNELLAIKSELQILNYRNGNRIKDYRIIVENDELIILDEDEEIFEYYLNKKGKSIEPLQKLQESLFHEKEKLIENCFFGVDINPNSINICRLRLWIELLKNSYYTEESNYKELETLPNIDINIKLGNSLINRFDIKDNITDLPIILQQKIKLATKKYKEQVLIYKATTDKVVKRNVEKKIEEIKKEFENISNPNDKDYVKLKKLENELTQQVLTFSKKEAEEWEKKREKLQTDYDKIKSEYEEKLKSLYGNAFEWRFEFPEVLDENGNFVGFDVVIGNPPYFSLDKVSKKFKDFYSSNFIEIFNRQSNIYFLFIYLGGNLIKENGLLSFINEQYYFSSKNAKKLRIYLKNNYKILEIIDFRNIQIFDDVNTLTTINIFQKNKEFSSFKVTQFNDKLKTISSDSFARANYYSEFYYDQKALNSASWSFTAQNISGIKSKMLKDSIPLSDLVNMGQGITTGRNNIFIVDDKIVKVKSLEKRLLKKYVKTKDIKPYNVLYRNLYLLLILDETNIKNYSNVRKYLTQFRTELKERYEIIKGKNNWYSISVPRNLKLISRNCEKLLTPLYSKGNKFGYISNDVDENYFFLTDVYFLISKNDGINLKYLVAILNSKLFNFYTIKFGKLKRDNYYEYSRNTLSSIPIKIFDASKQSHIIELVDKILSAKKTDPNADTSKLESEIDKLIYKLYGLTEEEIKIVEDSVK